MAHYAISMADGSLAIMQTVGDVTPEECLAKWHPDEQAKVKEHHPLDPRHIPGDRTYRDAWALAGGMISHDMRKASDIHRDRLRALRAPLLAALDVAHLRADETGDVSAKFDIAKRKQALRAATKHPAIDGAATVDELKALTLDALTKA